VPIKRRCCRKSSGMLLMSCVPFSSQMLQCTTENWWRRRAARSDCEREGSWMVSWTMGGGSMTRRSRSPKPQLRAAEGCWRTVMRCEEVGVRRGAVVVVVVVGAGRGLVLEEELEALLLLPLRRLEMLIDVGSCRGEVDGCVLGGLRGSCGRLLLGIIVEGGPG
jgi:hypothetical protein